MYAKTTTRRTWGPEGPGGPITPGVPWGPTWPFFPGYPTGPVGPGRPIGPGMRGMFSTRVNDRRMSRYLLRSPEFLSVSSAIVSSCARLKLCNSWRSFFSESWFGAYAYGYVCQNFSGVDLCTCVYEYMSMCVCKSVFSSLRPCRSGSVYSCVHMLAYV